jgi:hypothetical protein
MPCHANYTANMISSTFFLFIAYHLWDLTTHHHQALRKSKNILFSPLRFHTHTHTHTHTHSRFSVF